MKTKSLLTLMVLAVVAIACGGGNTSGGGGSNGGNGGGPITQTNTSANYQSIKNAIESKSFQTGLNENVGMVHAGYAFTGNTGSFNVNFNLCLGNWIQLGDCENNGNPMSQYADMYRIMFVQSANQNSATFRQLNTDGQHDIVTIDRSDELYRDMLNLNYSGNQLVRDPVVTQVNMQVGNSNNVRAYLVEYFYGYYGNITEVKRYIIAPDLPVAANPVAIIDQSWYSAQLSGHLMEIQGQQVHLQAQYNTLVPNNNGGITGGQSFQVVPAGTIQF
jgi:hypothetical protein